MCWRSSSGFARTSPIINKGHIVANGSLDEPARGRAGSPYARRANVDPGARLTLEQIFLNVVGGESGITHPEQELTWL